MAYQHSVPFAAIGLAAGAGIAASSLTNTHMAGRRLVATLLAGAVAWSVARMGPAPDGIPAFIHPDLFPYGNIADGDDDAIAAAEAWLGGGVHPRARALGPTTWHAYRAVVVDGRAPSSVSRLPVQRFGRRVATPCPRIGARREHQRRSAQQRGERLIRDGWRIQPLTTTLLRRALHLSSHRRGLHARVPYAQ